MPLQLDYKINDVKVMVSVLFYYMLVYDDNYINLLLSLVCR